MTERQSLFFRKNSSGQLAFYPWLYPGQGFVIDPNHQKSITTLIKIFAFSFVIASIALDLSRHYLALPEVVFVYLKTAISIIFPVAYYYKTRKITHGLIQQETAPTAKPLVRYILIFLIFVEATSFTAALHAAQIEPALLPLLPIIGIYILALITLTIRIYKGRGF